MAPRARGGGKKGGSSDLNEPVGAVWPCAGFPVRNTGREVVQPRSRGRPPKDARERFDHRVETRARFLKRLRESGREQLSPDRGTPRAGARCPGSPCPWSAPGRSGSASPPAESGSGRRVGSLDEPSRRSCRTRSSTASALRGARLAPSAARSRTSVHRRAQVPRLGAGAIEGRALAVGRESPGSSQLGGATTTVFTGGAGGRGGGGSSRCRRKPTIRVHASSARTRS